MIKPKRLKSVIKQVVSVKEKLTELPIFYNINI